MDPSKIPPEWLALPSFSMQVTVHIAPDNVERFLAAMRPSFAAVAAEPKCLYFEIFQDPASPGTLSWVETWDRDFGSFVREQLSKEYMAPYFAATEPMFIKEREVKVLKRVDGFVSGKEKNFKGAFVGDYRT